MSKDRIVIFGAGIRGKRYLKSLLNAGIKVDYICDNNELLWGEKIEDCLIISPKELEKYRQEVQVLIANKFHGEAIKKQLQEMKIKCTEDPAEIIFRAVRMKRSGEKNLQEQLRPQLTVVIYGDIEDKAKYGETYQSICEQKSSVTFNIKKWNEDIAGDVEDYVLLIKSGAVMLNNSVNELWMTMEENSIVGSKTITKEITIDQAGYIIGQKGSIIALGQGKRAVEPEYEYVRDCDAVSMNGMLLRKRDFIRLVSQCKIYNDEVETAVNFAVEMRNQGKRIVMTPFSLIITPERESYEGCNINVTRGQYEDLKGSSQRQMLLADTTIAQYDTNAGNRSTDCYIQIFLELGMKIVYVIDDFYYEYQYVTYYQRKGIFVVYGERWKNNVEELLSKILPDIKYAFLNRPEIAAKYIGMIRKYSSAMVVHYGHDLHYLRLQREYEIEKDPDILAESERMKKIEYTLIGQVDITGYPSMEEVKILKREFPTAEIEYFPLYFFSEPMDRTVKNNRKGILFVGGFSHTPNQDAALWLVRDILPILRKRGIEDPVYLVGSNPTDEILALQSQDVIVTGYVTDKDLQTYYQYCFVDILPLRYGAGMKGKVLEAMHNGIPTVTTTIGAEGLYGVENIICLGNTIDEIVDKACFLYQNKDKIQNIGLLEQRYIQEYFGKDAMKKLIMDQVRHITE